ncbi:MAG: aminotransferase class V-fold PLP-dependent enzyme [Defluviitaleaceae bacterium]|nr:aminotransferase class V-fold PLP-dependent enzyme [Defluviitaleaceae bacterium]
MLDIYFDNAATTPALPFSQKTFWGNPSSPHGKGLRAERALKEARETIAGIFNCRENEIVFTSGGTEANNLAIMGFALANKRRNAGIFSEPWEHPSITLPANYAHELWLTESPAAESHALKTPAAKTHSGIRLVSFSHVSHETGDVTDIAQKSAALKKENPETIIHVDGIQAFCKEPPDISNVDIYTFSGHKFHGGGGVGGLFLRGGTRILPLTLGGEQESGLRSGTENVHGILQMTAAAKKLSAQIWENHKQVSAVKAEMLNLLSDLPDVVVNALGENVSPYILNLSFMGLRGETLVNLLSEKGIYASMGAACRSRKKRNSLLEAMGFSEERAKSAVRFSFSFLNTVEEAAVVRQIIIDTVSQLRRVLR